MTPSRVVRTIEFQGVGSYPLTLRQVTEDGEKKPWCITYHFGDKSIPDVEAVIAFAQKVIAEEAR